MGCSGFPSFVAVLTKVPVPATSTAQPNPTTQKQYPQHISSWTTTLNMTSRPSCLQASRATQLHSTPPAHACIPVSPSQSRTTSHQPPRRQEPQPGSPQPPTRRLQNGESLSLTGASALAARMPDVSLPAGPSITDLAALSLSRIQCRLNWQSMCLSVSLFSREGFVVH
jgi:hypothetical protein